jgi:hypothetical protein
LREAFLGWVLFEWVVLGFFGVCCVKCVIFVWVFLSVGLLIGLAVAFVELADSLRKNLIF